MGRTPREGVSRKRRRTKARRPRWVMDATGLDEMAQRRCLMILSVLSGEKSVDEASREAQVTPGLYYQLEKKALSAMLAALVPGAGPAGAALPALAQLESRVAELEATKRRLERLLYLTRMTVKSGPMTQGRPGRPPRLPALEAGGPKLLRVSKKRRRAKKSPSEPSTPTSGGEGAP